MYGTQQKLIDTVAVHRDSRGQLGAALHLTQCTATHPFWHSRSLIISPGTYYQTIKLNDSLPTSILHVGGAWLLLYGRVNWGPAWAHIYHNSYQLGRGTTSPLSPFAFPIALKWGSILSLSVPVLFWGGIIMTLFCSSSMSHLPNIVPPSLRPGLDNRGYCCPHPSSIFECPSIFTFHLIVQLAKTTSLELSFWEFPPHDPKTPRVFSASHNIWSPKCHIHSGPWRGWKTLLALFSHDLTALNNHWR